jgi:2-polyprenyl-6-methoxyphenol hydroxylase-like FAD-dependent oxidoreductase
LERIVPPADEIGRRIEEARAGSRRHPVLVVACDGAHAPTRRAGGRKRKRGPGAWKEAKGARLYLLGRDHRIIHVASWHEIGRRGLPRGSGGIESANKLICHVRLTRSGAWWLEGNGNAMLRIRCAIYNGTFPQVFADYTATQTVTPSNNK